MSILVFDTETTGLIAGQICQLSYITENDGELGAKNFFFRVERMDQGASAINGLTPELLMELSGGRVFSDDVNEIARDFVKSNLIISHNFSFDYAFLNTEFLRTGRQLLYQSDFCTMRRFTPVCQLKRTSSQQYKYPKLSELMKYLGVTESETADFAQMVFNQDDKAMDFHDARFDTAALYLCVKKGSHYFPVLEKAIFGEAI